MNKLLSSEALKLRSTRSFWLMSAGALALVAGGVASVAAANTFSPGDHPGREVLALAGPVQTFALLFGVLAVTNEFRHGTVTSVLLVSPKRTRLLLAKALVMSAWGFVLGLVAFGAAAAVAMPLLAGRDIASQLSAGQLAEVIIGGAVTTALAAALGVGVGSTVRSQVGAVIAVLGLLYLVEPLLSLLPGISATVQRYGIGGLSSGASGTTGFPFDAHVLAQVPAVLVLGAYALIALVVGAALLVRRDITA
jgi:ABC-type transport system involved in multi-copper enzyme maturation permease subunit